MIRVKMDEAKTNLSRLAARAAAGEAVILMRGDTPIARIVPLAPEEKPRRQPGRFKGVFRSRRSLLRTAAGGRARSLEQSEVRLLLDAHAWFCWNTGNARLAPSLVETIRSNQDGVYVSAASVRETVTKHRLGKLPDAEPFIGQIEAVIKGDGFLPLAITTHHAAVAASFDHPHKDPVDRLLIAQALSDQLTLV